MANGIGRVWAANAGDDEQRPNGVGSVWIENIDALASSGGASEQQINELSAAIEYVSANAGDPNALTGYQEDGVDISATSGLFEVSGNYFNLHVGEGGHLSADKYCSAVFTNGSKFINTNGGFISADGSCGFATSSQYHDLRVETNGKISANNAASAVFTNGSLVSADSEYGFLVSAGNTYISATTYGLQTKTNLHDISAAGYGIDISSYYDTPLKYRTPYRNITLGSDSNGFAFNVSSNKFSACIDNDGAYGISGNGYIGSFGKWSGPNGPVQSYGINGIGFSGINANFGVFNAGNLKAYDGGKLSANNNCSAIFSNGSRTEITNGHTLLVGNNDKGTGHGIIVSGNGNEFIKIYNGGSVKAIDGAELNLSGTTHKIGQSLNASGSRFVSADSEDVSAWAPAPMTVMGTYNETSSNAAFVIGNGSANTARSDLFVIDYSGNAKSNDFVAANGNKLSDSIQTSDFDNLYNAFTAYTAAAPKIKIVTNSAAATGSNILYVVTGSN